MATEATIQTISKALGEADAGPLAQIQAVVDALGEETCLALLAETDRIEKAGGMERGDGKGRRSAGGEAQLHHGLSAVRVVPSHVGLRKRRIRLENQRGAA